MTKPYLIRDENCKVFNRVEHPACVVDTQTKTLLKIGEKSEMLKYFNKTNKIYREAGFTEIANDLALIDLPKDQDEIDKVFQNTNYVAKFIPKN